MSANTNVELLRQLKLWRLLASIIILLGSVLLIFMIIVEDEPGAIPLLLILTGAIWFAISQRRLNNQSK